MSFFACFLAFYVFSCCMEKWNREQKLSIRGTEIEHLSYFYPGYFTVQRPVLGYLAASFLKVHKCFRAAKMKDPWKS